MVPNDFQASGNHFLDKARNEPFTIRNNKLYAPARKWFSGALEINWCYLSTIDKWKIIYFYTCIEITVESFIEIN